MTEFENREHNDLLLSNNSYCLTLTRANLLNGSVGKSTDFLEFPVVPIFTDPGSMNTPILILISINIWSNIYPMTRSKGSILDNGESSTFGSSNWDNEINSDEFTKFPFDKH